MDIRGRVNKEREGGSDFFRTTYEGLKYDYLDAHIPGAVFVDWTKVTTNRRQVVHLKQLKNGAFSKRNTVARQEQHGSDSP